MAMSLHLPIIPVLDCLQTRLPMARLAHRYFWRVMKRPYMPCPSRAGIQVEFLKLFPVKFRINLVYLWNRNDGSDFAQPRMFWRVNGSARLAPLLLPSRNSGRLPTVNRAIPGDGTCWVSCWRSKGNRHGLYCATNTYCP